MKRLIPPILVATLIVLLPFGYTHNHLYAEKLGLGEELERGVTYIVGVVDEETAKIALDAGFQVLFLSGAWVCFMLGDLPDTGNYRDFHAINRTKRILQMFPDAQLMVDIDGGFGTEKVTDDPATWTANIEKAVKTVRLLKVVGKAFDRPDVGAAGVVVDDQVPEDRKAELDKGKRTVPRAYFMALLKALREEAGDDFTIVGRTAEENPEIAQENAKAYAEVSDKVIIEAIMGDKDKLASFNETNPDIEVMSIQLDKREDDIPFWGYTDHEEAGVDGVIMANLARKQIGKVDDPVLALRQIQMEFGFDASLCAKEALLK